MQHTAFIIIIKIVHIHIIISNRYKFPGFGAGFWDHVIEVESME